MSDNVDIGGKTFAAKDTNGVLTVRDLITFLTAGAPTDVTDETPLPVTLGDAVLSLSPASLAALEQVTVSGTVALDSGTLAALESVTVTVGNPTDVSALATQATLAAVLAALGGTLTTSPTTAGDVAGTLTDGRKTVPTPTTAVALRGALACRWVCVTALKTNTGQVNVGGSSVLATLGSETGQPLGAGESVTIPVNDAAKVSVDARVAGEGVTFTVGS